MVITDKFVPLQGRAVASNVVFAPSSISKPAPSSMSKPVPCSTSKTAPFATSKPASTTTASVMVVATRMTESEKIPSLPVAKVIAHDGVPVIADDKDPIMVALDGYLMSKLRVDDVILDEEEFFSSMSISVRIFSRVLPHLMRNELLEERWPPSWMVYSTFSTTPMEVIEV
jgi:hypothetical protein